jgi:hypothetical protein
VEPLSRFAGVPIVWDRPQLGPGESWGRTEDAPIEATAGGTLLARIEFDGPVADATTAAGKWFLDLGGKGFSARPDQRSAVTSARIASGLLSGRRLEVEGGRKLRVRDTPAGVVLSGRSEPVLTLERSAAALPVTATIGPEPLDEPALSLAMVLGFFLLAPGGRR